MKSIRSTSFLAALAAAAFLTACGSSGVPDILGGPGNNRDDSRYDDRYTDVRGTVDRVDTVSRRILVSRESDSTYLRNGSEGRQVALYYDDRTTVAYNGQTYRPEDLENGDRIEANVEESGNRLVVQDIQVLYDSSTGTRQGDYRDQGGYRDEQGYRSDDYRSDFLRGTVRFVDTRARTVEIEPSSNSGYSDRSSTSNRYSDPVVVHYDSGTRVEYQGRRYQPSNLERGDVVEIDLSRSSGTLMAEQITVVDSQTGR